MIHMLEVSSLPSYYHTGAVAQAFLPVYACVASFGSATLSSDLERAIMPIDVSKIPERIKEAVKTGNLVPFVGAGLSRQAVTTDPKAFPTWLDLLKELAGIAEDQDRITAQQRTEIDQLIAKGNFLMAAQAIKSALPADLLESIVQERFAPKEAHPGTVHHVLFKLRAPLVVTTNYDLLLEDAYELNSRRRLRR
jgi:hypothetical protein